MTVVEESGEGHVVEEQRAVNVVKSRLPKKRLHSLMRHFRINEMDDLTNEEGLLKCRPLTLDSSNVMALLRLWRALDKTGESISNDGTLRSFSTNLMGFFSSEEYKKLYCRFESLFLWPVLLGLASSHRQ